MISPRATVRRPEIGPVALRYARTACLERVSPPAAVSRHLRRKPALVYVRLCSSDETSQHLSNWMNFFLQEVNCVTHLGLILEHFGERRTDGPRISKRRLNSYPSAAKTGS